MKKLIGTLVIVLILGAGAVGTYKYLDKPKEEVKQENKALDNKPQETKEQPKEETKKEEATNSSKEKEDLQEKNKKIEGASAKDNTGYVDELMANYKIIYEALLSNKDLAINNIEATVIKDSEFYNEIVKELKSMREKSASASLDSFTVSDIKYDDKSGLYEAYVKESTTIKQGTESKVVDKSGIYKVKLDSKNSGIISYVKK